MSHAFALSGTNLISFDTATPGTTATIPIANLTPGETLVGIDFRPQNGLLYGLGVNAASNTATLYVISTRTGFATAVGTPGQVAFTTDGVTPVDLPDPATVGWGFDFNPSADRIRVTAGSLNFRVNPNNGAPVDSDVGTVGTNPDTAINGATTTVDAAGYTNNAPNGFATTLYTLDGATNSLYIQNPPNNGTETLGQTVTLNGNPLDFSSVSGFDVPAGVNVASSNSPVTTGSAFAVLTVGGTTGLYSINLVNAQATFIGPVGGGAPIQGLAIQNDLGGIPAISLTANGTNLTRFNTATPGTSTTVALDLASVVAGETIVAIDFRPQTGQLYAFGVNATADTGTLYLVDPQTGFLTVVGAPSGIAFAGEDFPDPATSGYGMDFNPVADRIRITTDTGLNFRLNPNNGAPVAATTDTDINGSGSSGVSATAYTNSYGQQLASGATTLYTLDAASNMLFIQNPANNGTQTSGVAVTLGGSPLDFSGVNGFDIPAGVSVTTSNTVASGFGYAALIVGGVGGLYQIDLATGVATNLGALPASGVSGFTLADAQFAPAITSNGAGTTAGVSTAENSTAVTTVTAYDGNFDAVTFAIVGGADAAKFQINGGTGALSFLAAPNFEAPTDADTNNSYIVQVRASDGSLSDTQTITVSVTDVLEPINLTPGDDSFSAPVGSAIVNGLGGIDTIAFGFALTDATVTYAGNTVTIDSVSSHTVLTGFEKFVFTDGTVDNNDGDALVDDLFYYAQYHDVWNAHVEADFHYHVVGWTENRDPSAFFDTSLYRQAYPDAAAVDPLVHFDAIGWTEGRMPSLTFGTREYLLANPDVAAANIDPLAHFLAIGASEGRQPIAPAKLIGSNGFDYVYYLNTYADVKAAGVDPLQHFLTTGWTEGRNPNALFDTSGYLATYTDVAAANINPFVHYNAVGWKEGRDPSVGFDTTSYLAAYPDVAAANVNPLMHFLHVGQDEGRSPFADGIWG
jgi:hypothetical protein